MASVTDERRQPGLTDLVHRARARAFVGLVRVRRFMLPILASLALWIASEDSTPWRRAVLFSIAGILCTVALVDVFVHRRVRRFSIEFLATREVGLLLGLQVGVIALVQSLMFLATGGLASPVLPAVLPVVFLAAIFISARAAWLTVAAVVPLFWAMAIAQARGVDLAPSVFAFADGHINQPPVLALTLAGVMTVATAVVAKMGSVTRGAIDEMVGQALASRDEALVARSEQTRELTTLSAEIAHELKNPLASIKGLAALVDRELSSRSGSRPGLARTGGDEKSIERIAVLRREVDRMQDILDEFLNFSRPLVPLTQRASRLRALVGRVVDLHEGLAAERRVTVEIDGEVEVVCDPRKVEQIVINLVQNALQVAPHGSRIEIELASADGRASLVVRDEGPGLTEELRERVFDAGVTTKPAGSGLGLTIARALARQHGGELELTNRSPSGCEARLHLPLEGAAAE